MTDRLQPLSLLDGSLPLRDLALLGDGATSALVGRDGVLRWLCLPRFDSPPVFASLLDDGGGGGGFRIAPEGLGSSRQRYEPGTAVVVTEMRGRDGTVRLTDAMTLRAGADLTETAPADRQELVRRVEVLEGPVTVEVDLQVRGGAHAEPHGDGLRLVCRDRPDLRLGLRSTRRLDGLHSRIRLERGDRLDVVLDWHGRPARHQPLSVGQRLDNTVRAWRQWSERLGPRERSSDLLRRSAITLKLLDHAASGAIVAAPTSSLPERIGGQRNWDYRYVWLRDAAFSVYALRKAGFPGEAAGFLGWVLDTVEHGTYPGVVFDLDGRPVPAERIDEELGGFRGSRPVRWGNAAGEQRQHDSYGEILDCAYQWASGGGQLDDVLWQRLCSLADQAAERWDEPDHGIWEVRTTQRRFTYSAGLCHVAVDRAARLAQALRLPGEVGRWQSAAEQMRKAVLTAGSGEGPIPQHLDGGGLDASVLALPLRRVVPVDHPRLIATVDAVRERLGAGDGLLYRYLTSESPDGVPGGESAFLLCSFWLVQVLAHLGRVDEAGELFDTLLAHVSPVGLLPEQIAPSTGDYLGNYPQALSHVGLIAAASSLQRAQQGAGTDTLALPRLG